jgi:lysozyme family protein
MDRNFARCLSLVLKHEGGWADNPKDPGRATMKGVTIGTFRAYVKPNATKDDLRKITNEQIATVYRRHYWDKVAGAELPDGIDYAVFDFAVNSGPDRAAKYLQKVAGVTQDGKIGPATIKATRDKLPAGVINRLCDDRLTFLKRLKTWSTFGKGWSTRVKDVRSVALEMSAAPTPEKPKVIVKEVPVVETVEVEKPVVPQKVEEKVKEKADWLSWLTGGGGLSAIGLGWLTGMDWQAVLAGGVVLVVVLLLFLLLRSQIIAAVRGVREAVEQ